MRYKKTTRIYAFAIFALLLSVSCVAAASIGTELQGDKEARLITDSKTLSHQAEVATNVYSGRVVNVGSIIDEQGRIFTIADISINVVLKGDLTSQITSIKYLGGTVGNLGLTVDMRWPAGDYALPTTFDLQLGQELIIFVDSDNNVLSYIENPFASSIRSSLLSQGLQPTTAVTEAQGYAFNWNASQRHTWAYLPICFTLDPDGTADVAGTSELTAVRDAFSTWEGDIFSGIDFYDNGTGVHLTYDNYNVEIDCNVVGWLDFGYYDPAAATLNWWSDGAGFYNITETHLLFNDRYTWCIGSVSGQCDVQNIATHEIGHWLRLQDLYDDENSEQTMYWRESDDGETKRRSLEYGDINGAHYLYPIENDAGSDADAGNSLGAANTITKGYWYIGRMCYFPRHTDTQDWFKINLHSTDRVMIQMMPASWANFDLEVYDPDGILCAFSRSATEGETEYVALDPTGAAGYWYIRIYAPDSDPITSSGAYTFRISHLPLPLSEE